MNLFSMQKVEHWQGKKVLLRVDFNISLGENGEVDENEDWRIKKILPTITFLRDRGAKIIILSHLGREKKTLKPIANYLNKFFKVKFIPSILGEVVKEEINKLKDSEVLLLENLRQDEREEKNDQGFSKELAELGDLYVNDAFSVCHRKHASIVSLPEFFPSYLGLQLEKEIENLELIIKKTEHPFLFILGGAKFETKIPLIEKYLKIADQVFIAGALMNNFFREKGMNIKKSIISEGNFNIRGIINNRKLILPDDLVWKNEMIVDVGDKSLQKLEEDIKKAKIILFNGPIGYYDQGSEEGTIKLLKMLTKSKAKVIIGGGDTLVLVEKLKLQDKFYFISTGGGAMLEFLLKGTLPGIEALRG